MPAPNANSEQDLERIREQLKAAQDRIREAMELLSLYGLPPPVESQDEKHCWEMPWLPDRVRRLAACLHAHGALSKDTAIDSATLARATSEGYAGFEPARVFGMAYLGSGINNWIRKHIKRDDRGLYFLSDGVIK